MRDAIGVSIVILILFFLFDPSFIGEGVGKVVEGYNSIVEGEQNDE